MLSYDGPGNEKSEVNCPSGLSLLSAVVAERSEALTSEEEVFFAVVKVGGPVCVAFRSHDPQATGGQGGQGESQEGVENTLCC